MHHGLCLPVPLLPSFSPRKGSSTLYHQLHRCFPRKVFNGLVSLEKKQAGREVRELVEGSEHMTWGNSMGP